MSQPSDPPSGSASDRPTTPSLTSEETGFTTVDWTSIDGGTRLVWLRPVVASLLVLLLVGGAVHTLRHDELEAVAVAGREVAVLNWMYGLALLLVAVVVVPPVVRAPGRTRRLLERIRHRPVVAVAGIVLLVLVVVGSLYPRFAAEPEVRVLFRFQPPAWMEVGQEYVPQCHSQVVGDQCQGSLEFPLGTGWDGRDLLTVGLYGLNTSLQVGITATVLAVTAGVLVGTVAGYVGGWPDELLMRYVDVQRALPSFFVYILLLIAFARSYALLILVLGLLSWGGIARLVRSEVVQLRTTAYVRAARQSGASGPFVVVRHVLPNASNTIVTATAVLFAKFVVYEAALSFLSLTDPSVHSLGNEIAAAVGPESAAIAGGSGGGQLDWTLVPWIVLVPVGLLCLLLFTVGILGDGLRDVFDPRS